ncbi:MAG: CHAD domain-containing protein [Methanocorpusculum sp.]|nr:CHAD domain-containing protein [Methanocorpusculum sp.]
MTTNMDEGYRLYGATALAQLAADMAGESAGVKAGTDIEYIHRMRVASRRLRAALPLFAGCFPEKEYTRWENEIKQITRSLGRARDLDVQIAFLRDYAKTLSGNALPPGTPRFLPEEFRIPVEERPARPTALPAPASVPEVQPGFFARLKQFFAGSPAVPVEPEPFRSAEENTNADLRSGIECLTLRLMQERTALQPDIICAVERFEKSKTLPALQKACMEIIVRGKLEKTETTTAVSYNTAYYAISFAAEQVKLYAKALADPERVTAHHEMRIAAKKLRYTMETYRDLYGDGLAPAIRMVKDLQDYLGDMHDCDVWTEFLPGFLAEEEEMCAAYFGNTGFMETIRPGIAAIVEDRKTKRTKLHAEVNIFWKKNESQWKVLEQSLTKPLVDLRPKTISVPDSASAIAFFADVHANLPALLAITADAKSRGCTTFLYAGDVIGFGPFPEETLEYLQTISAAGVLGNAEEAILAVGRTKNCPEGMDKKRCANHKKTWKKLSDAGRAQLFAMPAEIRFTWGGQRIVVMHHPVSPENICSETPAAELERFCADTDADVIICGHTHRTFAKKIHGVWVANTGGAGRSGDGALRASYLLVTRDPFSLHHIRVPYDLEETLQHLKKQKEIAAMFAGGLDFDEAAGQREIPRPVPMQNTVTVTAAEEER